jgi:zinc protease
MRFRLWLGLGLLTTLGPASAAARGDPEAAFGEFARALVPRIQKTTLPGGLRIVMNVDHRAPTVGVCATYDVGTGDSSACDRLARRVEAELIPIIRGRGGELDVRVQDDRSVICAAVPSHELEVAVWAATAWLRPLVPSGPDRAAPGWQGSEDWQLLRELVLGDEQPPPAADPAAPTKWYRPDRTVLSVAGDFDADRLVELLSGELAPRPAAGPAPEHSPFAAAVGSKPRVNTLARPGLLGPVTCLGWQVPPKNSADYPALDLVADLLGGDASSLLGLELVGGGLAEAVEAHLTRSRGPNVLGLRIVLAPAVPPERVKQVVGRVLGELARRGPQAADWARAQASAGRRKLLGWEDSRLRATWLGAVELELGDPRAVAPELGSHARIDRAQARDVVGRYLGFAQASVLKLQP